MTARWVQLLLPARSRDWRLTWHLVALCAVVLMPVLVTEGILLVRLADGERDAREAEAHRAAGRIMAAIDAQPSTGGGAISPVLLPNLLRSAVVPAGMIAVLADETGEILARSQPPAGLVGPRLPPELRLNDDEQHGWRRGRSAAGDEIVMALSRSARADRWVALFMPAAAFYAPLWNSLWVMAALVGGQFLLVASLASLCARGIARPIAALAEAAGRENGPAGAPSAAPSSAPSPAPSAVREVNVVARALQAVRAESVERLRQHEDLLLTLDQAHLLVREVDGRILVWTSGAQRLYGWTPAEALGRNGHALLQTEFPLPLEDIAAALMRDGEWEGELRQRRADGGVLTVVTNWALRRANDGTPRAVVEVSNDITGLRSAEAALRLNRDLLASVLDASPEPISARDVDGRQVILNRPAASLLGTSVSGAIGRTAEELLTPELAAESRRIDREVIASGQTLMVETSFGGDDGAGPRTLVSSKAPWRDGAGRVVGVVAVSRDITVRRQAQERLQELQGELLLISRLSAMGALAAELAHELNQPLTAVTNFANAAKRLLADAEREGPASPQLLAAHEAMTEAADQAVHAGKIVRRLRGFIGRAETTRLFAPIGPLVEEAVRLALAGSLEPGVQLRLEIDPDTPSLFIDRVQLQQVVVNLVRNALEAMEAAPRRTLCVSVARSADDSGPHVELVVADSGPGIDPAVADRLFDPFVTTKPAGMGIGLSICRTIVEEHAGRLSVREAPGGGAAFCVCLPIPAQRARTLETVA